MEAIKTLIFGTDSELHATLKPYYDKQVKNGKMEIVGYLIQKGNKIYSFSDLNGNPSKSIKFQKIVISSQGDFVSRRRTMRDFLRNLGISEDSIDKNIIDGRVFQMSGFDFLDFCQKELAIASIPNRYKFLDLSFCIQPRVYTGKKLKVELGVKSYVGECRIEGENEGLIQIGNFSATGWECVYLLGLNNEHHYENVSSYELFLLDWHVPGDFFSNYKEPSRIIIGSDVWVGRGCRLKVSSPNKPLVIGNGAILASDSVVVKDVPPYAIVGGNPAKIIRYRFDQEIIEALERIAWWNWDLDKISDNYHLFKNPKDFVRRFDPQG